MYRDSDQESYSDPDSDSNSDPDSVSDPIRSRLCFETGFRFIFKFRSRFRSRCAHVQIMVLESLNNCLSPDLMFSLTYPTQASMLRAHSGEGWLPFSS
jgi:hypothetical protein